MPRTLTAAMLVEIVKDETQPILLGKFEFDSGDVNLWTGYGEIQFNGDTYTGGGNMVSVSTFQDTETLNAKGITAQLTGIPLSNISLALQEIYQGRKATLFLGFIGFPTNVLIADPVVMFSGKMDVMRIEETGETSNILISVESELIDLKRARLSRYTDAEQKRQFPLDRGLEFVTSIQNKSIRFGS